MSLMTTWVIANPLHRASGCKHTHLRVAVAEAMFETER